MSDLWGKNEDLSLLFGDPVGKPPPSVKGSDTSKAAAHKIKPSVGVLRAKVLAYIEDGGGATDEEAQKGLGMNPSTQRPRRIELVERGAVKDSGLRRPTISGRPAAVWVAVPEDLREVQAACKSAR